LLVDDESDVCFVLGAVLSENSSSHSIAKS